MAKVVVSGATGYMGRRLIPMLLQRGHTVRAIVREGSQKKLPSGCECVVADVLKHETMASAFDGFDTLVHLVGVAHPGPGKEQEFINIDMKSVDELIAATVANTEMHCIYLSVAHPAPLMKAYWTVREQGERKLFQHFARCSFVRPWYVLGPGHRWAVVTKPFYTIASLFSSTRDTARRLQLVNLSQMINTLVFLVENPPDRLRIVEADEIAQH